MHETRRMLERRIDQALGATSADLVIRNARILDVVTSSAWTACVCTTVMDLRAIDLTVTVLNYNEHRGGRTPFAHLLNI